MTTHEYLGVATQDVQLRSDIERLVSDHNAANPGVVFTYSADLAPGEVETDYTYWTIQSTDTFLMRVVYDDEADAICDTGSAEDDLANAVLDAMDRYCDREGIEERTRL